MVKNTLNVGNIEEGFVLDHIQAGRSMDIYKYLHLDKLDCCVAIIKNAKSSKMGKKDIMKIECPIDFMDLDVLGFIDHNILRNYSSRRTIVRAIPNTAMAVGRSMTFICHADDADPARISPVTDIFDRLGTAAVIPEQQLGAAMALCSCGIAYVMRFIRAASEGAVELGLYPDKAKEWFLQTMRGAVELLESTGANPESEIDKVTTPGGLTIRGLNAMEESGFSGAVIKGLRASVKH